MAFAALTAELPPVAWLMLLANIFWAIAYDTEYAMVDRDDDLKLSIRSSAIFFGRYDVMAILVCYVVMLLLLALVGWMQQLSWPYYLGLVAALLLALYHISLIRDRQRELCFKAFLHNNWLGAAIFAGLLASYL
jgi:4-hydroxybenzoate polyprenyltransferase